MEMFANWVGFLFTGSNMQSRCSRHCLNLLKNERMNQKGFWEYSWKIATKCKTLELEVLALQFQCKWTRRAWWWWWSAVGWLFSVAVRLALFWLFLLQPRTKECLWLPFQHSLTSLSVINTWACKNQIAGHSIMLFFSYCEWFSLGICQSFYPISGLLYATSPLGSLVGKLETSRKQVQK